MECAASDERREFIPDGIWNAAYAKQVIAPCQVGVRTCKYLRLPSLSAQNMGKESVMKYMNISIWMFAWAFWSLAQSAVVLGQNDEVTAVSEPIDFAKQVLPILEERCFACHGPELQQSNYRIDIKSKAFAGGDFGDPPILAGDSAGSPLMEFITADPDELRMPPSEAGPGLTQAQIELIGDWINQGAVWPEEWANESAVAITTDHWSFQSLQEPTPPLWGEAISDSFRSENPIDRFVADQLTKHGLEPSESADRVSLIRRLYLDVHGLQPTPQQIQAFVNDTSADAWEKVVNEVLSSHHYGERWARHWLDIVRFGESTGFEVNRDRANAWYYRDYVIDSLNRDKSFRDFVIEQLAGDVVGVDEATGFLVGGAYDTVKSPDVNLTLMQREDELADFVNTTSTTFLGLTVGCARCHNHKFDPILQKDYYSLQAVFSGVQHGERALPQRVDPKIQKDLNQQRALLQKIKKTIGVLRDSVPPPEHFEYELERLNAQKNIDQFSPVTAKFVRFNVTQTSSVEPCLDELEVFSETGANVALASEGAKASSSGDYPNNPKHQLSHINDGNFGNDHSWISNELGRGWVQIELPDPVKIHQVVWGRDRSGVFSDRLPISYSISVSDDGKAWTEVSHSHRHAPFLVNGREPENAFVSRLPEAEQPAARALLQQQAAAQQRVSSLQGSIPKGYVGTFGKPKEIKRLHRGDPLSPREIVEPDTLQVMGTLGLDNQTAETDRRLRLAEWIASEENPLTARVIVNRVWQFHFGRGLVNTPSDFGKAGARPTHPELLDWLALQFMENGWSLKWLHRQILTSSTYQQSSQPRPEALALDAGTQWLWRFPPRRLEAEAIRDCVLQLSGKLNLQAGGPGFLLFRVDRENVHHYFPLEEFGPEHFRRMIYMTKIRQEQDEVFGVFDCPDGGQTIPNRSRSTTALQALNLLNSKFMQEQAAFLAARLKAESGDPRSQISMAFMWALGRQPDAEEMAEVVQFVDEQGLEAFCRVLMNTNEFLFLS